MTSPYPSCTPDEIAWLTEAQMIEVDRVMIDTLLIGLTEMMENAGRALAQVVIDRFAPSSVTVLAGSGGNGGGGLAAARHLANRGVDVSVTLSQTTEHFAPVPGHQYSILRRMGVSVTPDPRRSDVVIDALIGYSLRGAPRGRVGELISEISEIGNQIVSLDTPSGLNVTDGSVPGLVVNADATLTLALPKIGLRDAPQVGELYLADISVPPSVYDAIGVGPAPDFSQRALLRILRKDDESR
jgi:NAD(P)H-hydrate epimerase